MARYPGAEWRPVARYQPGHSGSIARRMHRYDGAADHTFVGDVTSNSAFNHFNTPGNATPHFMINEDGSVDQYIDTDFMSSAILEGNHRMITWETWDGFPSHWSGGQAPLDNPRIVEAKARLMVWLHRTHGIPLVRMPNSRSTSQGFGWHRMGIDGNFETAPGTLLGGRVTGGEKWSGSFGKTCPTSRRIRQYVEETLPRAIEINSGDDVTLAELNAALEAFGKNLLANLGQGLVDNIWTDGAPKIRLSAALDSIHKRGEDAHAKLNDINADLARANTEIARLKAQQTTNTSQIIEVVGELSTGDLTEEQIAAAVKRALREGTGTA